MRGGPAWGPASPTLPQCYQHCCEVATVAQMLVAQRAKWLPGVLALLISPFPWSQMLPLPRSASSRPLPLHYPFAFQNWDQNKIVSGPRKGLLNSHVSKNICETLPAQSPPYRISSFLSPPLNLGEEIRSPSHCSFQAQNGINKKRCFHS